ncbi:hypothetical protein, partial [Caulobacter sp. B11]|uniref:hypothetical protein n=1 Tax=Caulobacter sp. B11 TaxID=2048899 RepID=UPI00191BCAE9
MLRATWRLSASFWAVAGPGLFDDLGRLLDQVAGLVHPRFKHGIGLLADREGDLVELVDAAAGRLGPLLDALAGLVGRGRQGLHGAMQGGFDFAAAGRRPRWLGRRWRWR